MQTTNTSPGKNLLFAIEEVTSSQYQYMRGMNRWLEEIFPEYCPPRFDRLLSSLRRPNGRHQIQIFVGLVEKQVAGLAQLFYRDGEGVSWLTSTCSAC
jgi:hypothetical protein